MCRKQKIPQQQLNSITQTMEEQRTCSVLFCSVFFQCVSLGLLFSVSVGTRGSIFQGVMSVPHGAGEGGRDGGWYQKRHPPGQAYLLLHLLLPRWGGFSGGNEKVNTLKCTIRKKEFLISRAVSFWINLNIFCLELRLSLASSVI